MALVSMSGHLGEMLWQGMHSVIFRGSTSCSFDMAFVNCHCHKLVTVSEGYLPAHWKQIRLMPFRS